ncbi:uncharacterized protein [Narcine bancroftii]|uniref:uncharacterized protein isoform X3 n=1 Tax=Narcine bancroftii TaxID=1343680 RepID=UPI003831A230
MSFPKQQALEGTQKGGEEKKMLQFVEMVYVLFYLLTIWSVFTSFRMCEAVPFQSQKNTTNILQPRSCWENEEYSIIRACSPCTDYEKTVYTECTFTGFVEELKCAEDRRYKSSETQIPCASRFHFLIRQVIFSGNHMTSCYLSVGLLLSPA